MTHAGPFVFSWGSGQLLRCKDWNKRTSQKWRERQESRCLGLKQGCRSSLLAPLPGGESWSVVRSPSKKAHCFGEGAAPFGTDELGLNTAKFVFLRGTLVAPVALQPMSEDWTLSRGSPVGSGARRTPQDA